MTYFNKKGANGSINSILVIMIIIFIFAIVITSYNLISNSGKYGEESIVKNCADSNENNIPGYNDCLINKLGSKAVNYLLTEEVNLSDNTQNEQMIENESINQNVTSVKLQGILAPEFFVGDYIEFIKQCNIHENIPFDENEVETTVEIGSYGNILKGNDSIPDEYDIAMNFNGKSYWNVILFDSSGDNKKSGWVDRDCINYSSARQNKFIYFTKDSKACPIESGKEYSSCSLINIKYAQLGIIVRNNGDFSNVLLLKGNKDMKEVIVKNDDVKEIVYHPTVTLVIPFSS